MPSPAEITVARLARLVGTPDAPHLVDVRIDEDVDANARFPFVAPSEVEAVAARFGAEPFGVEGARFGHRGEAGERCTFDTVLDELGLETEALRRLATVVRAAGIDAHDEGHDWPPPRVRTRTDDRGTR